MPDFILEFYVQSYVYGKVLSVFAGVSHPPVCVYAEDAEDVEAEGVEASAGNAGGEEKGGGLLKRLFGRLSE